ncbi:MAG: hypothetical protein GXY84_08950 [Clostridiales bacterium]|nr:hypothetical protein [Clostridiales bacterium]
MRARVLFLTDRASHREELRLAQSALSELAIAFSQSISMREQMLPEDCNPDDLSQLMLDNDAILFCGSQANLGRVAGLAQAYAASAQVNHHVQGLGLSRLKTDRAPALRLVWPLEDSPEALTRAATLACAQAKASGSNVAYLTGNHDKGWWEALSRAAMYAALPAPQPLTLDGALWNLLNTDKPAPLLMANPMDAALLRHLLAYLGGSELIHYQCLHTEKMEIQAVVPQGPGNKLPFFSLLYAVAQALRNTLHMTREGDCLDTATSNVLASGWRTAEFGQVDKVIPDAEALDLVNQQVRLAGELYERLG